MEKVHRIVQLIIWMHIASILTVSAYGLKMSEEHKIVSYTIDALMFIYITHQLYEFIKFIKSKKD